MDEKSDLISQLEKKYIKTYEISNLKDLLIKAEQKYAKDIAFKVKENGKIVEISFEQYKSDVEALATALLNRGLQGKPICIIGKNSYQWAISYIAIAIIGIVVPLDKELHIEDIINFMNVSESVAILGDLKYIEKIKENKDGLKQKEIQFIGMQEEQGILSLDELVKEGKDSIEDGDQKFKEIEIDPDEMHILLFTSGTTGNSKAVCLSHKNICSNIMSVAGIIDLSFRPHVLSILPIHHTYECTLGYLLVIYSGGCIAYCDGLRYISNNMQEYQPNVILCVPLLLENVHKKIMKALEKSLNKKYFKENTHIMDNLPFFIRPIVRKRIKKSLGGKMKMFIVGAAAMNPEISSSFKKFGLRVVQGYGLTECSPLVAGNTDFFAKDDAVGLPIPNVQYKIVDPKEDGVGEIAVKGPNVMIGYYKDEEATNKTIKDGWFYTGDLGRIDKDGYLYVTGRSKSVIVTKNGKNIYPEELEYYLNEDPLIAEAIVLGVEDKEKNETYVKAKIFPNIDAIKSLLKVDIPTKEQIMQVTNNVIQSINKKIPNYKHIKGFKIVDKELEKTTTQKIKRYGKNMKIDE